MQVVPLTPLKSQLEVPQDEIVALRGQIHAHATTRDKLRVVEKEQDQAIAGHSALSNTINQAIVSSQTTTATTGPTPVRATPSRSRSPPATQGTRSPV